MLNVSVVTPERTATEREAFGTPPIQSMTPTLDGTRVPVLGHRNSVRGLIELYEADGQALGGDRAVNFPSTTYALHEMI